MIQFDHVSKRYPGGHEVLSDVSFTLRHSELVVLSGHSGAGKSTLMKLIAVLERPTTGKVFINGQAVSQLPKRAVPYLRRNVGLVLQESKLLFDRNVFDNVMLPLVIAGIPLKEGTTRVSAALERVGLAGREREMPITLSGGEQQRVAIARAVVNRPSILLADEPTAHLDPDYAHDIAALFMSFNRAGVSVMVATHDPTLFAASQPRRLVLAQGKLIAGGDES